MITSKDGQKLVSEMTIELCKVDTWFKANKLSLDIQKSSYMIFTPRNQQATNTLSNVHIANNILERVTVTTFLGTLIDENLTWKNHITLISNKIAKNIGVIRRIRHLVSRKIHINLYYTMIYPYISYCNIV